MREAHTLKSSSKLHTAPTTAVEEHHGLPKGNGRQTSMSALPPKKPTEKIRCYKEINLHLPQQQRGGEAAVAGV